MVIGAKKVRVYFANKLTVQIGEMGWLTPVELTNQKDSSECGTGKRSVSF